MTVPAELDEWIEKVGLIDPNSGYFRYPVSKNADADKEKSLFKDAAGSAVEKDLIRMKMIDGGANADASTSRCPDLNDSQAFS